MTAQTRLRWTTNLVALSLPVLTVGLILPLVIGATTSMM